MLRILLPGIAWFFMVQGNAQNLVGNKGFEERNTCTEYGVQCAPEAWFFFPRYAKMSPTEPDSNHYEVILMGNPRDEFTTGNYIYTKLFCQLVPKATYRFSFRIYVPTFDFDYLDLWFTEGEPGRARKTSVFTAKPSFTITPLYVQQNKKAWAQVHFTFTAKGDERFLMIGNFQHQELKKARRSSRKKKNVEYWVDDIVLQPTDSSAACSAYEAIKDQVYRNNGRHPARFIESVPIDSSLILKPPGKDTVVTTPPPVVVRPVPKPDTLIIPDVLFQFNSSRLNPSFAKRLDSLGNKISKIIFGKLLIAGHTDNVGADEYNLRLSSDRAVTIKNYFVTNFALNSALIETAGYGESQPRATNATAAGRQQNRRVEIIIYYK